MNLEPLLTTSDVAKILGLSEKTIRKLKERGLVPINFGGRFRYRKEDVAAFIEKQRPINAADYFPENNEDLVLFPGLSKQAKQVIKKRVR